MKTYQIRLVLEELEPEKSQRFPSLCVRQLETFQVSIKETEEEGQKAFEVVRALLHLIHFNSNNPAEVL